MCRCLGWGGHNAGKCFAVVATSILQITGALSLGGGVMLLSCSIYSISRRRSRNRNRNRTSNSRRRRVRGGNE